MCALPLVSVVMPVYNVAPYVEEAVASILGQTFRDFELILVDDGSTDGTETMVDRMAKTDERIRLTHQKNRGLVASLNRGCDLAAGKYIARMDGDDISLPTRFEKQVALLEASPRVGICGTQAEEIWPDGRPYRPYTRPKTNAGMKWYLMFGSCFAHPSVMMSRGLVRRLGGYRDVLAAEDHDLWARASEMTSFANIPEVLVRLRVRQEGQTCRFHCAQQANALTITGRLAEQLLGRRISPELLHRLRRGIPASHRNLHADSLALARLLLELYRAFGRSHPLRHNEELEVRRHLAQRLWILAGLNRRRTSAAGAYLYLRAACICPRLLVEKMTRGVSGVAR